jgi:hypothetical protein
VQHLEIGVRAVEGATIHRYSGRNR